MIISTVRINQLAYNAYPIQGLLVFLEEVQTAQKALLDDQIREQKEAQEVKRLEDEAEADEYRSRQDRPQNLIGQDLTALINRGKGTEDGNLVEKNFYEEELREHYAAEIKRTA